MTLTGAGVGLVSALLLFSQYLGLPLTEADIVTVVTQTGIIVSAGTVLYGLVRKVINSFSE